MANDVTSWIYFPQIFPPDTIQLLNSGGEIKGTINPGTITPVMAASFGKIPKLEKKIYPQQHVHNVYILFVWPRVG